MKSALAVIIAVATLVGVIAAGVYLFASGGQGGGGPAVASLTAIFNDVQARKARELSFEPAEKGQSLAAKDAVKTGVDSRAVVTFESGLVLNVDPDSLVTVVPPSEVATEDIFLERGSVSAGTRQGFTAPKRVTIRGKGGEALAVVSPKAGEGATYRVQLTDGKAASIAVLQGEASVDKGAKKVVVRGGEAVDLASGEQVKLPPFPTLEAPADGASIDLSAKAGGGVELRWGTSERGKRYHLQIASGVGFDALLVDQLLAPDARTLLWAPKATGSFVWRVAAADDKNREGEYGFPRRFAVTALPGQAGPPDAGRSSPPPPPLEPLVIVEPFKVSARAQGGLQRKGRADKDFKKLTGPFTLRDGDVVRAEGQGAITVGKGSAVELAPASQALFASAKPDKGGKRKEMVMKLEAGTATVDLQRAGDVSQFALAGGGAVVRIRAIDKPSRARAELREGGDLRVVAEKSSVTVTAGGRDVVVEAGQVLDVSGGQPGEPGVPLASPVLGEPRDHFSMPYQDSPPHIAFTWKAVEGAVKYRFVISRGKTLLDPVGSWVTDRTVFEHNNLKAGLYAWGVYSVDAKGRETLNPVIRSIELTQDRTPPVLTISSPCEVQSGAADQKAYCSYTATGDAVDIAGKSSKTNVTLKVDGKPVKLADDGSFTATAEAQPGLHYITVEASDRAKNAALVQIRVRKD